MPSKSFQNYHRNNARIFKMFDAHQNMRGTGRGKRALDHFSQSIILMLSASWESYIEDVLFESANFLKSEITVPKDLPEKAIESLLKSLKGDKFSDVILSKGNWKDIYIEFVEINLYGDNETKWGLNSPNPKNIDKLCEKLIGYEDSLSSHWCYTQQITDFVRLRGAYAHKGRRGEYLKIENASKYLNIVDQTVRETDILLYQYLQYLTFYSPWNYTYKK